MLIQMFNYLSIDTNSNMSNDSELVFYGDDSAESNINIMLTDELMAQESWRNKAEKPIKIKKDKTN